MARVVDVQIFDGDIPAAAQTVLECCRQPSRENRLVSATGAHGIVTAHRDPVFRQVLTSFYMNLADGMPAVWISRLKGDKQIKRCYGPDFMEAVISGSAHEPIRHYLCGGKPGVAEELARSCRERFGNANVVGVFSPPFREPTDGELKDLAQDINARNADIVWVGLSTPRQEVFASRLAAYTRVHFLCTVGAAFDFHTGRLKQAPRWMQRHGLEWFFRLVTEPRRLWTRYFTIVPLLIVYGAADLFQHFIGRERRTPRQASRS